MADRTDSAHGEPVLSRRTGLSKHRFGRAAFDSQDSLRVSLMFGTSFAAGFGQLQAVDWQIDLAFLSISYLPESFRGRVSPRHSEGFAHHVDLGHGQINIRVSTSSPCSFDRLKNIRIRSNKLYLSFRTQFDHRPVTVRISECGKNFPTHPKIGMMHVPRLDCFRKTERDSSKFVCGHN
jgi:hypothetical protein